MKHSHSNEENQQQDFKYQDLLNESGGKIVTSVTALQDLENKIDKNLKVEKSPKGKKESFFKIKRGSGKKKREI